MVMDTAPETKLRAIERLGATIVKATYDECWRTVETHALRSHARPLRASVRRRRLHRGNGTVGLEILEDLPDVDAVDRAARRRRAARRHRRARCTRSRPAARSVYAAEPETAAPLAASLRARRAELLRRLDRRRSSTAPAASRCCRRCGRCCAHGVHDSIVVSLDEAARAMRLVAERVHVIAEGAAACAVAAALSPRAARGTGRSSPSSRAATSISRRFAQLVGALSHRSPADSLCRLGTPDLTLRIPDRIHRLARARASTSGGAGTRRRATCSAGSTTRCGGRPRTTRC